MKNCDVTVDKKKLEAAKKERMQHRLMVSTIHDVISYLIYLVLLTIAANSTKDIHSYRFQHSLTKVFFKQGDPLFEQVLLGLIFVELSNIFC